MSPLISCIQMATQFDQKIHLFLRPVKLASLPLIPLLLPPYLPHLPALLLLLLLDRQLNLSQPISTPFHPISIYSNPFLTNFQPVPTHLIPFSTHPNPIQPDFQLIQTHLNPSILSPFDITSGQVRNLHIINYQKRLWLLLVIIYTYMKVSIHL